MKCYFLDSIQLTKETIAHLDNMFANGATWVLRHESGDAMAYFDFNPSSNDPALRAPYVSACISGRHYNCDAEVLSVLETLRTKIGGRIMDDE